MAQTTFTSDGRAFTGRQDLTDHDHDALLSILQCALESVPAGTDLLNVAVLAVQRAEHIAYSQGWSPPGAQCLATAAGRLYADVIKDAHREELIDARRR